jgi:hypothetical protein
LVRCPSRQTFKKANPIGFTCFGVTTGTIPSKPKAAWMAGTMAASTTAKPQYANF